MASIPIKIWRFSVRKMSGSALSITIIISTIIGILSSMLILLAYYNREWQSKAAVQDKLRRNLQSAIEMALADTSVIEQPIHRTEDLFGEGLDSVQFSMCSWGVFRIGCVRSFDHGRSLEQSFLYGRDLPDFFDGCLYVVDHDRPAAVVGKTFLIGDAHLPKAGIRPAYIDQRGYDGKKLVDGNISVSDRDAPALNQTVLTYLDSLLLSKNRFQHKDTAFTRFSDSVTRSFQSEGLFITNRDEVDIQKTCLAGKIIIYSDTLITVEKSAILKDVILVAPKIRIKSGFEGRLQALSSDSIVIEDDCRLEYPSALMTIKLAAQKFQNSLKVGSRSVVSGCIFSIVTDRNDMIKTLVSFNEGSAVEGIAYINGYLMLNGTVYGSILTDFFLYRNAYSFYENHLVDATVDRKKLSSYFSGPVIFSKTTTNQLMRWVD